MPEVEVPFFHDIEIGETFQDTGQNRKLAWQYIEGSIGDAGARPVRTDDENGINLAFLTSFTLNTGFNTTSSIRLNTLNKNTVLASVTHDIFIGSTSDPEANLFPGGSAINHSQWLLYGPFVTEYSSAGIAAENYSHFSRLNILNNSGSNYTITIIRTYRYIANGGDSLT